MRPRPPPATAGVAAAGAAAVGVAAKRVAAAATPPSSGGNMTRLFLVVRVAKLCMQLKGYCLKESNLDVISLIFFNFNSAKKNTHLQFAYFPCLSSCMQNGAKPCVPLTSNESTCSGDPLIQTANYDFAK